MDRERSHGFAREQKGHGQRRGGGEWGCVIPVGMRIATVRYDQRDSGRDVLPDVLAVQTCRNRLGLLSKAGLLCGEINCGARYAGRPAPSSTSEDIGVWHLVAPHSEWQLVIESCHLAHDSATGTALSYSLEKATIKSVIMAFTQDGGFATLATCAVGFVGSGSPAASPRGHRI